MENYTKYKLKADEELSGIIAGIDNVFVIACNKCFKEFETLQEPELDAVVALAQGMGKTVTGTGKADFLCNKNCFHSIFIIQANTFLFPAP